MNGESPIATLEFRRGSLAGSHLSLFGACLVHRGGDAYESVPLDHIGSVGVAYERDGGRMAWGWSLLLIAAVLIAAFRPLSLLLGSMAGEVSGQSPGAFLPVALNAVDLCVSLLPAASLAVAIWGVALLVLWWRGETVMRVVVAPVERVFAVRGRDPSLYEFGESVCAQIARRRRA